MSSAFDWRAKAACRDKDPELFFPVGNTGAAYQQIEEAKAVCRTCKVIDACLKCALDTNQDYGVWGGLSEDERRALKRRAMRARRSQAMQLQVSVAPSLVTTDSSPQPIHSSICFTEKGGLPHREATLQSCLGRFSGRQAARPLLGSAAARSGTSRMTRVPPS